MLEELAVLPRLQLYLLHSSVSLASLLKKPQVRLIDINHTGVLFAVTTALAAMAVLGRGRATKGPNTMGA